MPARPITLTAVLLAGTLIVGGRSQPTVAATAARAAQLEFPLPLSAPGDVVEVGYRAVPATGASGYLEVRSNRQRAFTRVTLTRRPATEQLVPDDRLALLRATVPQSLLRGRRLTYFAVIRDARGDTVRVPASGYEQVWTIPGATRINLGVHRFGHVRLPDQVMARAPAAAVGFSDPPQGIPSGPQSFQVGPHGWVWLLDGLRNRVLVWRNGHPDVIARSVPLPFFGIDLALGPAGSVYVTQPADPADPPLASGLPPIRLARVSLSGAVLWQSRLATDVANTQLRAGSGGRLWWTGGEPTRRTERGAQHLWAPAATAGLPLTMARQHSTVRFGAQPIAPGLSLLSVFHSPNEMRYALVAGDGAIVHAWRVTSRTAISPNMDTAAMAGGEPVVMMDVTAGSGLRFRWEYEVLRLSPRPGGTLAFALRPQVFGDHTLADLQAGPGDSLYQLATSPDFGVRVWRYSLTSNRAA